MIDSPDLGTIFLLAALGALVFIGIIRLTAGPIIHSEENEE
jgi:hypothetical protein